MQDIAELIGWLIIGTPVVLGLVGAVVLNLWPEIFEPQSSTAVAPGEN